MVEKRADAVTTIAMDFSGELAQGERIKEILSVVALKGTPVIEERRVIHKGDSVGYFVINGDGERKESHVRADFDGEVVFRVISSEYTPVAPEELFLEYGHGQGPQASMVLVRLGKYSPITRTVSAGGYPGVTYTIRAKILKEFGDVAVQEEKVLIKE